MATTTNHSVDRKLEVRGLGLTPYENQRTGIVLRTECQGLDAYLVCFSQVWYLQFTAVIGTMYC
jgi:hypothetical protein